MSKKISVALTGGALALIPRTARAAVGRPAGPAPRSPMRPQPLTLA
jgi:hypothetical protein